MAMYEDIVFALIEAGHAIDAVMNYEHTVLIGYAIKKMQHNKQMAGATDTDGWQTQGNKRKKVMTSEQLMKKARAKKER